MKQRITKVSVEYPKTILIITTLITIFFLFQFPKVQIDTDPENMLPADEPVRVADREARENFYLYDFLVVGIKSETTAFTPTLLNKLTVATAEIEKIGGVIAEDIISPSTVDDISQGEGGSITIKTLVDPDGTIESPEQAAYILSRINENPLLRGKLASKDGKVIALFIPIESKDSSHSITVQIEKIIEDAGIDAEVFVAGLPLAEDFFGKEMFIQMGTSAPVAMLFIFILMFLFFRKAKLVMTPIILSMMVVIWTMGLLIAMGNTVHIMTSMIPIFLIPIAVLDSIHILSEFHDNFKKGDKKDIVIKSTISKLYIPMLYTSLTTAVGFLSLMLAPIPPVQVFGLYIAIGVLFAWILSITVVPSLLQLISSDSLKKFSDKPDDDGMLGKVLVGFKNFSLKRNKLINVVSVIIIGVSIYGLTLIVVNDNPVKWFKEGHPIRQADKILNEHLAGTYMNFLILESDEEDKFKTPEVAGYVEKIQEALATDSYVGATSSYVDIIKKVRFELFEADSSQAILPDNKEEIAQMLFMFELSGGNSDDLYKFVTSEYDKANIWVQLNNGDNQVVSGTVDRLNEFMTDNPPPKGIKVNWTGLPYINIVWQEKMVSGMKDALSSSFLVVLIMMTILFRSFKWGILSLLPLSLTILSIYAFIGFIGKPYNMPIAVLSSLTLGLSVDFSIHFIQRLRLIYKETDSLEEAFDVLYDGTARAIGRNVIVIAIGFIPMLFSSLSPYITVGAFFLAIMLVSGVATMVIIPSFVKTFKKFYYEKG